MEILDLIKMAKKILCLLQRECNEMMKSENQNLTNLKHFLVYFTLDMQRQSFLLIQMVVQRNSERKT